jgi:putative transposase
MDIEALYRRPTTSRRHPAHPIYPYLLRRLSIQRPNHVWATDICCCRPKTDHVSG